MEQRYRREGWMRMISTRPEAKNPSEFVNDAPTVMEAQLNQHSHQGSGETYLNDGRGLNNNKGKRMYAELLNTQDFGLVYNASNDNAHTRDNMAHERTGSQLREPPNKNSVLAVPNAHRDTILIREETTAKSKEQTSTGTMGAGTRRRNHEKPRLWEEINRKKR